MYSSILTLPIWHHFIKPDQLDPLIKNYIKINALSTIFTRYGKPYVAEPSNYRYPKVIMDIPIWIIDVYNWIMDITIPNCICVIIDIHDSIIDTHIWIIHNYTYHP